MIQVDDVKTMFEEIEGMRRNGWQSPKRASQGKVLHHVLKCCIKVKRISETED